MRCRRVLLAALLAGGARVAPAGADAPGADAARPEPPRDLRDTFGLSQPPAVRADCGDGLAFDCAIATDPFDGATPYALSTWLPVSWLGRLPVGAATHDAVASYALGASRDGAGVVLGGGTGLDNRWTIDGAPADSVRTGGADTRVPLAFLEGVLVTAGGFAARDRASVGGTIDARLLRGTSKHELAADAWLELSRAPSAPPLPVGAYRVRTLAFDPGPRTTLSLVGTGPLAAVGAWLGGAAWYAAGIAPSLGSTRLGWHAGRLVDADGDGAPDPAGGDVAVETIEDTAERAWDYTVPVMARAGLDRGAHHLELSLVGSVERDARFLAGATLPAAGVDRTTVVGDLIATWRGAWADTRARVQASWHRSDRSERARVASAGGVPQRLTGFIPAQLAEDPVLAAACDDSSPDDRWKQIANCPVEGALFASGGAGQLTDVVGDRPTVSADIARRFGGNLVRAGATLEDARLVTTAQLTGGEQLRALALDALDHRRFFGDACGEGAGDPCDYADRSQLTYRTRYAAVYAEDTFSLAPGLVVNDGLRWELMWVGSSLRFSHQLAPRAGMVWTPFGDGRARLWTSLGRTFAMLPAGLGATVIGRDPTVDDFELAGVAARVRDSGGAFPVADDVRSIVQDEVTLGGEVALAGALRATAWLQGRYLRHGLETAHGTLDNPGGDDPSAVRETEIAAAALELVKPKIRIRAGAMWGRTVGTWTGSYDPRQGATLLASPDWDTDATNLDGRLPTDAGARLFVESEHRGALGPVEVAVATRFTVGSGRPRNVLASGVDGLVALLPRGSAGRDPVVSEARVRVLARWRGVAVTLDVQNVFDRRDPTNLDEVYTGDTVRPVTGGDASDLVFLKNDAGAPARRSAGYRLPVAFQDPLAVTLGIHSAF
ncbi:MAG TPA: TonB-dependent receptor [Kofleriaceae bacterium]|nr:TonB-dependent receptor [Kofleriaceae bacterium]